MVYPLYWKVRNIQKWIKPFYRLYFIMNCSKIIAGSQSKVHVVVVNVLLPISCHIGLGMPKLQIFVVAWLCVMTDEWAWKLFYGQNKKISNGQVKFAAKNIKGNFIACWLSVKRVVTFGAVLCRDQWPVNFILHFVELQINSSIKYKNNFLNVIKPKEL